MLTAPSRVLSMLTGQKKEEHYLGLCADRLGLWPVTYSHFYCAEPPTAQSFCFALSCLISLRSCLFNNAFVCVLIILTILSLFFSFRLFPSLSFLLCSFVLSFVQSLFARQIEIGLGKLYSIESHRTGRRTKGNYTRTPAEQ